MEYKLFSNLGKSRILYCILFLIRVNVFLFCTVSESTDNFKKLTNDSKIFLRCYFLYLSYSKESYQVQSSSKLCENAVVYICETISVSLAKCTFVDNFELFLNVRAHLKGRSFWPDVMSQTLFRDIINLIYCIQLCSACKFLEYSQPRWLFQYGRWKPTWLQNFAHKWDIIDHLFRIISASLCEKHIMNFPEALANL